MWWIDCFRLVDYGKFSNALFPGSSPPELLSMAVFDLGKCDSLTFRQKCQRQGYNRSEEVTTSGWSMAPRL